jgi:membrane protein implicated in regulation of membrane protease activity
MDGNDRNTQSAENRRAVNFFALRLAVAGYLVYLGFDILRGHISGASALSPLLSWLCGVGFMAAALAFALYSWRRYRRECAAADKRGEAPGTDEASDGGN